MNEIKMCGIIIAALIICTVFKNIRQEYSVFVRIGITCLATIVSISILYPILSFIDSISKSTPFYGYIPILLKGLGIAYLVEITSDICIDANENALAERITLFGKAEIMIVSLPLLKNLFELCKSIV